MTILTATEWAAGQTYSPSVAPGNSQRRLSTGYERDVPRVPDAGLVRRPLEGVLSTTPASAEQTNDSNTAFVRRIYPDLIGRAPTSAEVNYWVGRLRFESRREMMYSLLTLFRREGSGTYSPPPSNGPGSFPDPAGFNFPDPSGPFFRSPYFGNFEYNPLIRSFPLGARG
jgi:hypothetical protein